MDRAHSPDLAKGPRGESYFLFPSPFRMASLECMQPEIKPDDLIMSKVINFSLCVLLCFTNSFQAWLICVLSSKFGYFCQLSSFFIFSPTSTFVFKTNDLVLFFFLLPLSNKQPHNLPGTKFFHKLIFGELGFAKCIMVFYLLPLF